MTESSPLQIDWLPDPGRTVMVLAFRGWNDAGESATGAVERLCEVLDADPFAAIDGEGFLDFQQVRPTVSVTDGVLHDLEWPAVVFHHATTSSGLHVVLGVGPEPHFRWPAFASAVVDLAVRLRVERICTFGSLLADVAHTRPSPVVATATDAKLLGDLGLDGADYEGPTGIAGVLHHYFAEAGLTATGIWASVPHYVSVTPNPRGTLALLEMASRVLGLSFDISDLQDDVAEFETSVNEAMADNDEVQTYVRMLEQRQDLLEGSSGPPLVEGPIPTGDELAEELERFLESQDGDS